MTLSAPLAALILVSTLVAGVVLVNGVVQLVRRGEWNRDATLGFVLATLVSSLIDVLVTFSNSWLTDRDAFDNIAYSFPAWAQVMQRGFFVLLLLASVFVFLVGVTRRRARLNLPAVLFVLVAFVSDASALLHGDNPVQPYYVVPAAVLVATTVAPRGLPVVAGLATFCSVVACGSGLAALLFPDFSLLPCGAAKCGLAGVNVRGVFDNENALALYLALAMPFVWLAFGRRAGTVLAGYFALLVLLTGSRSGSLAALVTLMVLVVVRPDLRSPHFSRPRAAVLCLVVGGAVTAGLLLPLLVRDPSAFTSRGYLWTVARQQLADPVSFLIGRGAFGWQHVRESGLIDFSAVYSVHNQWLDIAYKAGAVGLSLALGALVLLVVQAGRRYALVIGAVLVPVACLAATERPWAIDYADWLVWALPATLLCFPEGRRGREPEQPQGAALTSSSLQDAR